MVTYIVGKPLGRDELPFFCLRWSDPWTVHSEVSFFRKWNFAWDPRVLEGFVRNHRARGFIPLLRYLEPKIGWRLSQAAYRALYRHYARQGLRHAPAATKRHIARPWHGKTSGSSSGEPITPTHGTAAE